MEIIRAFGIAFCITKSAYIVRHTLKYETDEISELLYSTEYEAISRSLEHYFTFEVPTHCERETLSPEAICANFQHAADEHFGQ